MAVHSLSQCFMVSSRTATFFAVCVHLLALTSENQDDPRNEGVLLEPNGIQAKPYTVPRLLSLRRAAMSFLNRGQ